MESALDRDMSQMKPGEVYHLMIQTIVPRPIAWVLSDSGEGRLNLAPFSYFTGVTSSPPLLMLSVGHKANGSKKDTWRNIDERELFVVHIASREQASTLTATAAPLEHGESELEFAQLQTTPWSGSFPLPRVVGPKVAFACRRYRIVPLGDGPQGVIFGEILHAWLDDDIVSEEAGRTRVHTAALDPLARLGGDEYSGLDGVFSVPRNGRK